MLSGEKIFLIFEFYIDVIIKNWNEVFYGYKVCLVIGKFLMVLVLWVFDGNFCDLILVKIVIEKIWDNFGGKVV